LRRLIETADYREFITQGDEDTAWRYLVASEVISQPVPMAEPEETTQDIPWH
jgi:hypothetical protein